MSMFPFNDAILLRGVRTRGLWRIPRAVQSASTPLWVNSKALSMGSTFRGVSYCVATFVTNYWTHVRISFAAFDDVGPADSSIVIHKNNVISSSGRRGMLHKTLDITVHKIKWALRWYASARRIG